MDKNVFKNEVKKDLYKSKNMAKFSHYEDGKLFYSVETIDGIYQFPIRTFIRGYDADNARIKMSDDLGATRFGNEMKGSELIRWITLAIDTDDFIKIGEVNLTKKMDEKLSSMTREEIEEWMAKNWRTSSYKPKYCSCGNERDERDHYCEECIRKNPFLCT